MATFSDDFNRAELGSDWTAVDGNWSTTGTRLRIDGDATFPAYVAATGFEITSPVQAAQIVWAYSANAFALSGLVLRGRGDAKQGYFWRYRHNINSLYKNSPDGVTELATAPTTGVQANNQLLRMEIDEHNTISTFVNGVLQHNFQDNDSPLQGRVVGVVGHSAEVSEFDDFFAEYFPVAEPLRRLHNPRTNKVIPVLTFPTVTDIGATCVRPRITKGY